MTKDSIFSLDISSKSTGWCYTVKNRIYNFGVIKIKIALDRAEKLVIFRHELVKLLNKYKPECVVIENGFAGRNISTLKTLSKFAGVGEECAKSITGNSPYIMSNKTPKAYFEVKTKEELYHVIVKKFKLKDFKYDTHNDITDSIAQALCYYNEVVKERKNGE